MEETLLSTPGSPHLAWDTRSTCEKALGHKGGSKFECQQNVTVTAQTVTCPLWTARVCGRDQDRRWFHAFLLVLCAHNPGAFIFDWSK